MQRLLNQIHLILVLKLDPLVPRFRSDVFVQTVNENLLILNQISGIGNNILVPIICPEIFNYAKYIHEAMNSQVSEDLAKELKFKFTLIEIIKRVG